MPKVNAEVFGAKMKETGNNFFQSAVAAGMSPGQARKGTSKMTKAMLRAMIDEGVKLADLADEVGIEKAGKIAVGRLIVNAATGKDGGAMSAKILGSHHALNLWTPDTQVGVIVLNAPQTALDNKSAMLGLNAANDAVVPT